MSEVELEPRVVDGILRRASDQSTYERFVAQGESCGWCSRPVRLAGHVVVVDAETGERETIYSSVREPDGVMLKACGTRRATLCGSCAEVYRGDARQLVRAGLNGGKGVPIEVSQRPAVFATLTAPSFGAVHRVRPADSSRLPCRPGPLQEFCEHGRSRHCTSIHEAGDLLVGEPFCESCYDYESAVIWNALVGELWRRTIIYLRRMMARLQGMSVDVFQKVVRISYAKVVEYQKRGAVHVHAVIRLDGQDGAPPDRFDAGALTTALRLAVSRTVVRYPCDGRLARWGDQLDVRPVVTGVDGVIRTDAVANYIAKYSTKSVETGGALDFRLRSEADLEGRSISEHLRRLAATAWRLGDEPEFRELRLRLWAHDLGYRGHWLTKSRAWSTTFKALRAERQEWTMERLREQDPEAMRWRPTTRNETDWQFAGVGWASEADQLLADTRRRQRAESRRLAREAGREGREGGLDTAHEAKPPSGGAAVETD